MIAALLAEGSSDKALLPLLRWVLAELTSSDVRLEWIDLSGFPNRPSSLRGKVEAASVICRSDILFIHRDADNQPTQWRYDEIRDAVGERPHVGVVPIRTTEAWLLIDHATIRIAAGRVSGTEDLGIPPLSRIESIADPKSVLREALRRAHRATGRRAQRFDFGVAIQRIADLVEDWAPLRQLTAFRRLEHDTRNALTAVGAELRSS